MTARVEASVEVAVDPAAAFAALVDPRSQEKWIPLTTLYEIAGESAVPHAGSRLAAFTGIGSIGFLDTMTVTEYAPPHRWITHKDGDLLRGVGIMQVDRTSAGCRVTWANELELPLGILGRAAWLVAGPLAHVLLQAALRRLARQLVSGALPLSPAPATSAP